MPLVPATERDQYMEMVLRTQGRGVLSHATALDLHGLCDANPDVIHLTVPVGFRTRRQLPGVVRIHRKELQHGEHTLHEGIPIVTPLRAIRDGIEMGLGAHLIEQAITTALETGAITELEREQLDAAAPRVASARL
jgi:predicted transcriptional regulator of viral defense system